MEQKYGEWKTLSELMPVSLARIEFVALLANTDDVVRAEGWYDAGSNLFYVGHDAFEPDEIIHWRELVR